jgi:hypothetical protein
VSAIVLAIRHRRHVVGLLPKIATVALVVVLLLAVVVTPYVGMRATWGIEDRTNIFPPLTAYAFGQPWYPGTILLVLAAVGLLDRLRRPHDEDPRLPLSLAAAPLLVLIVSGVAIPGLGFVRSPGQWIVHGLPGLSTVRALHLGIAGVWLVLALLAAYGARLLTERRSAGAACAIAVALSLASLAEVFHPGLAMLSHGCQGTLYATPFGVSRTLVGFLDARLDDGAVLDLPVLPWHQFRARGHRVMLAAFHHRPLADCTTSYLSPLAPEVNALAERLPDPRAIAALHALGFHRIVLHLEDPRAARVAAQLRQQRDGDARLVDLGTREAHVVFRLDSATPARTDPELLARGTADDVPPPIDVRPPVADVTVVFRNGGERHLPSSRSDRAPPARRALVRCGVGPGRRGARPRTPSPRPDHHRYARPRRSSRRSAGGRDLPRGAGHTRRPRNAAGDRAREGGIAAGRARASGGIESSCPTSLRRTGSSPRPARSSARVAIAR